MKLLAVLVVAFSVAILPTESKVLGLWDYHSTLASMFSESCGEYVENPTGLDQVKEELDECYKAKSIPEPAKAELIGVPIGLEGAFPDMYLYASSYRDDFSTPQRGRLNMGKNTELGLNGAWCASINNDMQYFQVDFGAVQAVTGILTQGDHGEINWVKTYYLEVSMDGIHWSCVFGSDGRVKIFTGNFDSDTVQVQIMNPFIQTRFLRIVPKSWTNHICMRVEIYVFKIVPRIIDEEEEVEDVEATVLALGHKEPKSLVIKSYRGGIDRSMVPEQFVQKFRAPLKSISFDAHKGNPNLYQVQPAGGLGSPLRPNLKLEPLIISGGGSIVDYVAPSVLDFLELPREVGTFGGVPPLYEFHFDWFPLTFDTNIYVEFSFGYAVYIRGFSTRGRAGFMEYVKQFKVMYFHPYQREWVWLHDDRVMEDLIITGNEDDSSPRDHIYSPGIFTTRIRFYVLGFENKPSMSILLYMGTIPRQAPQVITGPTYNMNEITWAWNALSAGEGETQEIFFSQAFSLVKFSLADDSTIATYRLEYLSGRDQWRRIEQDEISIFSRGETISLGGVSAEGFRIDVLSWDGDDQFFGLFHLEVAETVSVFDEPGAVVEIRELANHYINFRWKESSPEEGSSAIFSLSKPRMVTRIEVKGCDGQWVSEFQLECRSHFKKAGSVSTFSGNTDDVNIVEHLLDYSCKYVVFQPSQYEGGICAEVFIYSSEELSGSTASLFSPGRRGGNFKGTWTLTTHGAEPFLEITSSDRITLKSITLEAGEENEVQLFELAVSGDGRTFEIVKDAATGSIQKFTFGTTALDLKIQVEAVRILPLVAEVADVLSFSFIMDFVSRDDVEISVSRESDAGSQPADPRFEISGNYLSDDSSAGQYIRFEFGKAEMLHKFSLDSAVLDCDIKSFKICYKTQAEDTVWTYISVDGTDTFQGNTKGNELTSIDLGDRRIKELKVEILSSEGGVKFEYSLIVSGAIEPFAVYNAFQDAQIAKQAEENAV